ncbi:MAG: hydrogenase iron-sulfur subunit [Desulfobacterales bacterium]|nr:hydrogenase iron-sulfur subunit [Desulfobacterales bacterium]
MDLDSAAPIQDKPAAKPDIGVFLCKCGKNIGGSVDIDSLAEAIKDTPSVKHVQVNTYTCSEPGQAEIETAIAEHRLEKIVVAACSPRLHGPTWQELLRRSDLNPAVVEVANIREQCSWVHLHEKAAGTQKALELVRMAVARAELLQPVPELKVPVTQRALVIGGGVAGIQAALDLADDGYETILVEKSPTIGGIMALIDKTFPTMDCSICILGPKMADAGKHKNIKLIANADVFSISGYVGNFEVSIRQKARYVDAALCTACNDCIEVCPVDVVDEWSGNLGWRKAIYIPYPQSVPASYIIDEQNCLGLSPLTCGKCIDACDKKAILYEDRDRDYTYKVGAIIVAVGFKPFDAGRIPEYGYNRFDNVLTTLEFERLINAAGPTQGELVRPSDFNPPGRVAFVNCVGSRDVRFNPYCSNYCCMESIKNALLIKEHWPDVDVTIFYMDIRAFGKGFEELYRRSREEGIRFVRGRPSRILQDPRNNHLLVMVEDTRTDTVLAEEYDLVVLSVGADGPEAVPLPLARSPEGFYIEAHPKLKPVDSPSDGVFIAGGAEAPKDIRETVTQASAAAGRAAGLLLRGEVCIDPLFAFVDTESCNACGVCATRCPYQAIRVDKEKKTPAQVNPALCKGCGTCAADCPHDSITMTNFTDTMILRQIDVALQDNPAEKVLIFACNWCSYAGADLAGTSRIQYPTNTRIVRTMCSGRVDPDFVKHAYSCGAGAVMLTGCRPQDCHYISGNDFALKREKKIRRWMKKNGIDDERFLIAWMSAAEGKKFADTVGRISEVALRVNPAEESVA